MRVLIALSLLASILSVASSSYAETSSIRALIMSGTREFSGVSKAPLIVRDASGPERTLSISGTQFLVKATGQSIAVLIDNSIVFEAKTQIALLSGSATGEILIRSVLRSTSAGVKSAEDRTYLGTLHVYYTKSGDLLLALEIAVEEYLRGVVPSEMDSSASLEALKAQAVAARSEAILAIESPQDPEGSYDLTSDVMSQVFSGTARIDARTDQAVRETRGSVLTAPDGRVVHAYYAAVCGGHSEDSKNVWPDREFLPWWSGHADAEAAKRLDLSKEGSFRKWISKDPDSYCNPKNPGVPERVKKRFRWELRVSAEQMQQAVATASDVGRIRKMVPLSRGVSGRLIKVRFIGEKGFVDVGPELAIRSLFPSRLLSAAFYIKTKGWGRYPHTFIIRGGGSGHGVGMCQVGAMGMAAKGKTVSEILAHYYPGTIVKKAYD